MPRKKKERGDASTITERERRCVRQNRAMTQAFFRADKVVLKSTDYLCRTCKEEVHYPREVQKSPFARSLSNNSFLETKTATQ